MANDESASGGKHPITQRGSEHAVTPFSFHRQPSRFPSTVNDVAILQDHTQRANPGDPRFKMSAGHDRLRRSNPRTSAFADPFARDLKLPSFLSTSTWKASTATRITDNARSSQRSPFPTVTGLRSMAPHDPKFNIETSIAMKRSIGLERRNPNDFVSGKCIVCGNQRKLAETLTTACFHFYCRDCLMSLCEASIKDESFFPPHCCHQKLDLTNVCSILGTDMRARIEAARIEYSTESRLYCFLKTCSAFISPGSIDINGFGRCSKCSNLTCAKCKMKRHEGPCSVNEENVRIFELASLKEWKQCPRCKVMIELSEGCNRIRCRCGYRFCYDCSQEPQNCTCFMGTAPARNNVLRELDNIPSIARNDRQPPMHAGEEALSRTLCKVSQEPPSKVLVDGISPSHHMSNNDAVAATLMESVDSAFGIKSVTSQRVSATTRANKKRRWDKTLSCGHLESWELLAGPRECQICGKEFSRNVAQCGRCQAIVCPECRT